MIADSNLLYLCRVGRGLHGELILRGRKHPAYDRKWSDSTLLDCSVNRYHCCNSISGYLLAPNYNKYLLRMSRSNKFAWVVIDVLVHVTVGDSHANGLLGNEHWVVGIVDWDGDLLPVE